MRTNGSNIIKVKTGGKIHQIVEAYQKNKAEFSRKVKSKAFDKILKKGKVIRSYSEL